MRSILRRLLNFDRLMGPDLVRLVYYFGAAVIATLAAVNIVLAFVTMAGGNIGGGVMQLIATPAVAAVVFVYWRFACELFMLAFLSYDRLGQVRDLMRIAAGQSTAPAAAAAPDPNHPAF
jgi:hypothetical protein